MLVQKSHSFRLRIVFVLAVCLSVSTQARPPLTRVADLRKLSPEKAEKQLPAELDGQVLWVHPRAAGFFLYQDGKGIYVQKPGHPGSMAHLSAGDVVHVRGVTNPGLFSPCIYAESAELLEKKPLPEARPFQSFEIYSAKIDCDWVWLAGRILSKQVTRGGNGGDNIVLQVRHHSAVLDVQIPLTEGAEEKVDELMFRRVRFNAVAGTQFNLNRQVVGRVFFVRSADALKVIDEYRPRDGVQLEAIHELMRSGDNDRHPARTYGVVTHVDGQTIYLRGEKACIKVKLRKESPAAVGDYVELEGYVLPRPISPEFLAREVHVVEKRAVPEPVQMKVDDALRRKWDFQPDASLNQELVQIEAQLVDMGVSFGLTTGDREHTLLCRHGSYLFQAKLPAYWELSKEVKPGATVRLTGICNLTRSEERRWRLYVDWFWIQPRGNGDIEVIVPAPWWTPARLMWLLGITLGIAALFIGWVAALRRTVERQTGIISRQVERETIMDERQRIARELHDNLEQGLAGMAIQLRGCLRILELNLRRRVESVRAAIGLAGNDKPELIGHLERAEEDIIEDAVRNHKAIEVVQGMLAHCSEESRSSILDLRGGLLERMALPEAIEAALEPLGDECGADTEMAVKGTPRRLKQEAERNLLLIAREAATNAARHAQPEKISIELTYAPDSLSLSIVDDGAGFTVNDVPASGRFGLQGMHERINRLNGTIQISSLPGQGTTVGIHLPSTREWELT